MHIIIYASKYVGGIGFFTLLILLIILQIAPWLLVNNKRYHKREESVLFGIKNVKEKVSIG